MAKKDLVTRNVKELAEKSRYWDVDDMLRNFDEQMAIVEHGLGHMIWDMNESRVTTHLRPMPVTPRFEVFENDKEFTLKATLTNVPKDQIRLNVERNSVELFACTADPVCRPHYLEVDARGTLDPDSVRAKMSGNVLEIKISKVKKKRLKIK